ncbi:MAG: chemotaxis protein CheA [Rhodocyclaceae bacterium]|nr:chemotaxis protein CheA [Rhodocyclaceae bacterium]
MDTSGNFSQALATFAEEARELIAQMEEILLRAEEGGCRDDDLHALFRCAHTLKGSGGLFGLDEVVRFTHVVENVLDRLRKGEIGFTSDLITVLLESQDQIDAIVHASLDGGVGAEAVQRSDALIDRLGAWVPHAHEDDDEAAAQVPAEQTEAVSASGGGEIGSEHWHISLRFSSDILADGMDPLSFIHYLSNYGEIVHVETVADHLPDLDAADPEACYLGFEVALRSDADKHEIEGVFDFIAERATIRIFPPHGKMEEFIRHIESAPLGGQRLGEILIACGTLTAKELETALNAQQAAEESRRIGHILVENQSVHPAVVEAAATRQRLHEEKRAGEAKSIKVPSDRLDALINRVGELVIAGSGTYAQASRAGLPELHESASLLLSLVEDIRDMTLSLRMVPIGEVFSRFPRVVRDVSRELGKDIELVITGADAELDKSMVEKLGDPLMHLIRNSMDHGIGSAEERVAVGKPAHGTVGLNAYHESGTIVVEVTDDGKGLDPAKILARAIDKGLVDAGAGLSEQEIFRLILEPGFSTAERITNLSGRGVGMDVVRANVEAMRGTLDIQSTLGRGTTMRLCLPLTLAIIDGFHVGVGAAHFIVPLDMVVECVELPEGIDSVDYMELRDEAMPFVRLREVFGETGAPQVRPRVVVTRFGGRRVGLVVDRIHGKCQTVIKPLGPLFGNVPCVSGSTILGSGEVALIIDVARLVHDVAGREQQHSRKGGPVAAALAPAAA